MADFDPFKQKL